MKKILRIFLVFSLGISLFSCDPKSHEIIDETPKVQKMDSMRMFLNTVKDYGGIYGTPVEQDVIDHVFSQAKDKRWDNGTAKTKYTISEHQLWAIWYDNYDDDGKSTLLDDYKHNRNYMIVLTKYGPQSLHGGTEIMDINGTIYYGFKIALRLE